MRWWPSNVPFKFTKRANLANLSGMSHPWWPVFLIWKQYLISFENIFLFVPFEPKIFSSMAFRILFFPFQFSLGILHSQFRILFFPHGILQKAFSHSFFHPFFLLIFTFQFSEKRCRPNVPSRPLKRRLRRRLSGPRINVWATPFFGKLKGKNWKGKRVEERMRKCLLQNAMREKEKESGEKKNLKLRMQNAMWKKEKKECERNVGPSPSH